MLHFLFGRRGNGPTGYSHSFWILSGPQGDTWKREEESNSPIQRKKSIKMLSLCEKLYLKQDRNPKCPRKGYWVTGGTSKGAREAFHIKGCCDAFYLQYWGYWTQHLNTSTAVHWQQCKSLIRLGTSIKQIWETPNSFTFSKEFLFHLLSSEHVPRSQ